MPSKTPLTGPRSENKNMLEARTQADPRTSPSRLGQSCKPRRGGSAKCGAKHASRRASGGWVVVTGSCTTRGMDVRDRIRQSEKAAGKKEMQRKRRRLCLCFKHRALLWRRFGNSASSAQRYSSFWNRNGPARPMALPVAPGEHAAGVR
jgi:hypothetical protein